ncbi:MAG: MBL fold metallo-hydrolase [Chlamydiales bacterium]|nr:MBL fold metallo-hydrolase [Chlamydiia bacterium]MCP5508777.1 MBL fold metallo-hydrolase [Chlamydiales bacterium]
MRFIFEQVQLGGDKNLGYLIGDRDQGEAAIIDPSYDPDRLIDRAAAQGMEVRYIINTHSHHDHVNGNDAAKAVTGAKVVAYHESAIPYDIGVQDKDELMVGTWKLQFLHTPGHCPDHLVIYNPDFQVAITGDILFVGKVGITRSVENATTEWHSLQRILKELPPESTVWPGHDYGCRPSSTLAMEAATNAFLCCKDLDEFLALKSVWKEVRREKGIL